MHHDRSVEDSEPWADYGAVETHWKTVLPEEDPKYPGRKLQIERGVVCITEFGKKFIEACHT